MNPGREGDRRGEPNKENSLHSELYTSVLYLISNSDMTHCREDFLENDETKYVEARGSTTPAVGLSSFVVKQSGPEQTKS